MRFKDRYPIIVTPQMTAACRDFWQSHLGAEVVSRTTGSATSPATASASPS